MLPCIIMDLPIFDQLGEERNGDEQIDVEQNMVEADDEELGVELQIDVALTEKDKELNDFSMQNWSN